jgi:hypothetical protein
VFFTRTKEFAVHRIGWKVMITLHDFAVRAFRDNCSIPDCSRHCIVPFQVVACSVLNYGRNGIPRRVVQAVAGESLHQL